MKSKKTKTEDCTNEQGDVTIPMTIVPCSDISSSFSKKRKTITKTEDTSKGGDILKKKICFWDKKDLDEQINWFVINISIDLKPTQQQPTDELKQLLSFDHRLFHNHHIENNNNKEKETILTPVFSFPKEDSPIPLTLNTFATLGSFVYSIGGIYDYPMYGKFGKDSKTSGSNLVYYFDTSHRYDTFFWKQARSMTTNRQNPQVIALNGKLYVFGCFGKEKCPHEPSCVWAETFDPSTNEWSSLPVPEFENSLVVCSPNKMKVNKIAKKVSALVDGERVYELDIETQNWTCVADNIQRNLCHFAKQPVVLVGKVVYWLEYDAYAHDILKNINYEGPVQDFSFQRAMNMPSRNYFNPTGEVKPATIHLGGRYFCVLSYLDDLEEDYPKRIHCLVVKLSKTNQRYEHYFGANPFYLRARVVSCQSFPIDRQLECLDDAYGKWRRFGNAYFVASVIKKLHLH